MAIILSLPVSLGQLNEGPVFSESTKMEATITEGTTSPPCGCQSGGATYIRWGNTVCPAVIDTELVYTGIAGGSLFNQDGGASNYLCMPTDPEYNSTATKRVVLNRSPIHGAEYGQPTQGTNDSNVPCTICRVSTRPTVVMIPAKVNCPSSWTREYYGFLMGGQMTDKRTTFVCVDNDRESLSETSADIHDGAFFYHTEASCTSGLPCTPYNAINELNCVVCTK